MSSIQKTESNIYNAYTTIFYPPEFADKIIGVVIMILVTLSVALSIVNISMVVPLSVQFANYTFACSAIGAMTALFLKNVKMSSITQQRFFVYYNEMDKLGFIKKEDEPNTLNANSKV